MPNIQLPDGSIVQFPEGMDMGKINTEIKTYWEKSHPKQMEGMLREPALAGSGLAKGAASILTIPHALADLEDRYIAAPLARKIEGLPADFGHSIGAENPFLSSEEVYSPLQHAGLIDRPDLQPQGRGERFLQAASQGAGAALPFALSAPASIPAALAQGAGAGGAIQGRKEVLPGNYPWLDLGLGITGAGAANAAESTVERSINAARGNLTPMAQAYKDVGIEPRLLGDTSQSFPLQFMQATAKKFPFSGESVRKAESATLNDFGDAVEKTAAPLGSSSTLQQAGTVLQDEGNKWLQNFKTTQAQKHEAIDAAIGQDMPIQLNNLESLYERMQAQAGKNKAAADFIASPLSKQIKGILGETEGNFKPTSFSDEGILIPSSGTPPSPITWQTARAIKTRVGEYLENPGLIADSGGAQAKRLYGALSRDMDGAIQASGNPQAQALYAAANAYTKAGHDFIDNTLSKINGTGITPENAAHNIISTTSKGASILRPLRQQMPKAADELGSYVLRNNALSSAGQQGAAGDFVSPAKWLTQDNKIADEAHTELFPNPDTQNRISALSTIAEGMKRSGSMVNNSNSGSNLLGNAALLASYETGKAGWNLGNTLLGPAGGVFGALAGGGMPYAAGKGLGAFATSPSLIGFSSGLPAAGASGADWGIQQMGATYGATQ